MKPILFLGYFYHESPENFEINRAERKKLHQIAPIVKRNKAKAEKQGNVKQKCKIDHSQVTFNSEVNGWYFGTQSNQCSASKSEFPIENIQNTLHDSLKLKIVQLNIPEAEVDRMLAENINVQIDGNVASGTITCGWCPSNQKRNKIKVSSKTVTGRKKNGTYWILSNFITHFNRCHSLHSKQKVYDDENCIPPSALIKNKSDSSASIADLSIEPIVNDEMIQSNKFDAPSNSISHVKVEVPNVTDIDHVERMIYSQITTQLTKMASFVQLYNMKENKIAFEIGEETTSLNILKTKPNGSCMFQSIAHQLFIEEFNSTDQDASTKSLRTNVVAHLKENMDTYKHLLNNTVFELMDEVKIAEVHSLCKEDMRKMLANLRHEYVYKRLPKSNIFGGSESLLSASKLHNVNVLVFSEDASFYFRGFNINFDRTICIAYRNTRDHYDSVTWIEQQDVFNVSKILAARVVEDLRGEIKDVDQIHVKEEGLLL